MKNNNKIRNLSVAEYFLQIQKEYIIADFRKRIYFSPKDKAYWTRVCNYKEVRINAIAERNKLNSIFNSESKLENLRAELFDHNGKPKFDMSKDDIKNYYSNGSEFCYQGEIYILDQMNQNGNLVLYSPDKEVFIEVSKNDVNRIL